MIEASGASKTMEDIGLVSPAKEAQINNDTFKVESTNSGLAVATKDVSEVKMGDTTFKAEPAGSSGLVVARTTEAGAHNAVTQTETGVQLPAGVDEPQKKEQAAVAPTEADGEVVGAGAGGGAAEAFTASVAQELNPEAAEKQRKEKLAREISLEVNGLVVIGRYDSLDNSDNVFSRNFPLNRHKKETHYTRDDGKGRKQEKFTKTAKQEAMMKVLENTKVSNPPSVSEEIWSIYKDTYGKALAGEASIRFVDQLYMYEQGKTETSAQRHIVLVIGLPKTTSEDGKPVVNGDQTAVDVDYFICDVSPQGARDFMAEAIKDPSFVRLFVEKMTGASKSDFMQPYGEVKTVAIARAAGLNRISTQKDIQGEGANRLYDYANLKETDDFLVSDGKDVKTNDGESLAAQDTEFRKFNFSLNSKSAMTTE